MESLERIHQCVQGSGANPAVQSHRKAGWILGKAMTLARFHVGRIVATPGALAALAEADERPGIFLKRHVTGDWGELDEADKAENEFSVTHDFRILSAYLLSTGVRLWIITEADRSATTLLLPEEY